MIHWLNYNANAIDSIVLLLFAGLSVAVYVSIIYFYAMKLIIPLQGSIDRTVKEMIKNDMVKDVKELEMFGSRLNERKISSFRHSNNESLWMRAFKSAEFADMKYLLRVDPAININERDIQNGRTPIIYASINNNVNAIKLLLNQPQIDINHRDNDGGSAFLYGVRNGNFEITKLLAESGASINTTWNDSNDTPLIIALKQQNVEIASYILENGTKYGLNISMKNSQRLPVRFHCWRTQNEAVINRYEQFESENKTELNENDDWITGMDLLEAFQEGNIKLARILLTKCKDNIIDTSVTDKNGQTSWVYCWKSKNISLITEYIEYHQNKNIKWDICEADHSKTNNALTFLFSKALETTTVFARLRTAEEVSLFELLINRFMDESVLWQTRAHDSLLQWLFSPWQARNVGAKVKQWKDSIEKALPIITEAIVTILYNSNEFTKSDMKVINTINKMRWIHFLEPSNSLKCIKYFVECIVNPKHPIKIETRIDIIMNPGRTIFDLFAQVTDMKADEEVFINKYGEILKWLKWECTISYESREKVIKFINNKTKPLLLTPLEHAVYNKHYHLAKMILNTFECDVNVMEKSGRMSTWLEIVKSKDIELIQLAVAVLDNNYSMNDISSALNNNGNFSLYSGIQDDTPLFWAVNNQLYSILQLMLNKKQNTQSDMNILNVWVTDTMTNSIWEYVTGLPNIYKLLETKENINDKKEMQIEYSIDNIDIVSMKLLITKHKINVNRQDSFGNQALFRICSIKYNKNNFDIQFEKQYDAVKILIENNVKIFKQSKCGGDTSGKFTNVWRLFLLSIINKETKISINDSSSVKQYIYAKVFGNGAENY